uniref:Transmembrane protein n=1 Tax=Knipowitschia caucasica TaxID=637954 RepID=A0AAV2LAM3_KNICA
MEYGRYGGLDIRVLWGEMGCNFGGVFVWGRGRGCWCGGCGRGGGGGVVLGIVRYIFRVFFVVGDFFCCVFVVGGVWFGFGVVVVWWVV